MKNIEIVPADIAASFQKAVTDVLIAHAMHAAETFEINKLAIAGGVASNSVLREGMRAACEKRGISFYHPSPILCTDNAAMIGGRNPSWMGSECSPESKTGRTIK